MTVLQDVYRPLGLAARLLLRYRPQLLLLARFAIIVMMFSVLHPALSGLGALEQTKAEASQCLHASPDACQRAP